MLRHRPGGEIPSTDHHCLRSRVTGIVPLPLQRTRALDSVQAALVEARGIDSDGMPRPSERVDEDAVVTPIPVAFAGRSTCACERD
jgi:hypothetical protein